MKVLRRNSHWVLFILALLIGGIFSYFINQNFELQEKEARQLRLEYEHKRIIDQFTNSVDKFAGLVSGMRSFMNLSPELPTAIEFQQFVKNQFNDINLQDSIVVSFVDTSHVFRQSFTRNEMNPVDLVGTSVTSLRDKEELSRLNVLMDQDSLRMFPPLNLFEGWVGLPVNFRVYREGITLGYVAPILDLKAIMQDIYNSEEADEFVFHFSTQEGFDFDRERIYDNTKVFNKNKDPLYYTNFSVDPSLYLYSTVTYYGFDIKIGTAYKNPYVGNKSFSRFLIFWFLTIALLAFIVTWQVHRFRKLNSKVIRTNKLLQQNRKEISSKNQKLSKLTNTQNKFFSIIGHDIKQPLNAIEGLLHLLQDEEINNPGLSKVVGSLTTATGNTVDLLNNLLRWAMSQTGDIKFNPTSIEINKLILKVSNVLNYQATEKSIKIVHELDEEISYNGDVDMLGTIFRNLISNAIKFTNLGGEIHISSKVTKDSLIIKVSDNGIGMDQEAVNTLFELGKQISTVGTSGESGTGLGLILCNDFVKEHGGHITVESELGKGTKFTVQLPL